MGVLVSCSIADCPKPPASRQMCKSHYMRWWRHGDPLWTPPVHTERLCEVEDCDRKHTGRGYCDMHLERVKRHGDPGPAERLIAGPGEGNIGRNGYRVLNLKDHPLSGSQNKVYAHRVALLDSIGPGTHPCHWCQKPVTWDGTWPQDLDALTVDHLDGDRLNNDPTNLVPSCNECNTQRRRRGVA